MTKARSLVRMTALLLLALVASLFPAVFQIELPTAVAKDDQDASIQLTRITPTVATKEDVLVIEGIVTNTSDQEIENLQLHFWRSRDEIRTSTKMQEVAGAIPTRPLGERMLQVELGQVVWVPSRADCSLAPGESAPFTVTAPLNGRYSLGFDETGVSYLVGAHLRGNIVGENTKTLARSRAFLPVINSDTELSSTDLVLLSAKPSELDQLMTTETSDSFSKLLVYAEKPGVTVLLDPALYQAIVKLTESKQNNSKVETILAKDWKTRIDKLISDGKVYRTQYGLADLYAALQSGDAGVLEYTLSALGSEELVENEIAGLPLLVVASGQGGAAETAELAQLNPAAIVVTNASPGISIESGVPIIGLTTDYWLGGPSPAPTDSLPQQLGRLRTTQLFNVLENQDPTITLVTKSADLAVLDSPDTQVKRVPLAQLLTSGERPKTYWTAAPQGTLSAGWLPRYRMAEETYTAWSELIGAARIPWDKAQTLASTWSLNWTDGTESVTWLNAQLDELAGLTSDEMVILRVTPTFMMGGHEAQIPLTVTNNLNNPIMIRLTFESEYPTRIDIPDTELVTILPRESDTIVAVPKANGNATVEFTVQIETESGFKIGSPKSFTIHATTLGNLGWVLIITSGIVLLGGTAFRIRQVRRARAKLDAQSSSNSENNTADSANHQANPGGLDLSNAKDDLEAGRLGVTKKKAHISEQNASTSKFE